MKWIKIIFKSMLAGIFIAIGCTVFLVSENVIIGAFLFSIGLITICELQLFLFTGKCGYIIVSPDSIIDKLKNLSVIWLGNYAGIIIYSLLIRIAKPNLFSMSAKVSDAKFSQTIWATLILGVFCGLLMYIAVEIYRKNTGFSKYIGILSCVPVFIICGFEHCIADMFYLSMSNKSILLVLQYILIVTIGNVIGSVIIPIFNRELTKPKEQPNETTNINT